MRIKKIYIENFRSIKKISFEPEQLNALVGPNSVGKTNILKAIDLVLGEGWTTKGKVIKELFNDVSLPLNIKIFFDQAIIRKYYGQDKEIQAITLKMKYDPGNFESEIRLWEYKEGQLTGGKNNEGFYVNEERKKLCCFVYIPASRNLDQEMRVNQWSMLGKIMKEIQDNYIDAYKENGGEDGLKNTFENLMLPAKEFLEKDFNEGADVLTFYKFVEEFEKSCTNNSLGLANNFTTKLNIYNLNWFYKTLQINLQEDFCNKDFEVTEVGSGMQNLVLLSIFQTYAKLMAGKVIFGIEEPEIYLHPQAQRGLYESFKKLSGDTQILYTTHNPNFIDAYRAHEILILGKNDNGTYLCERNKEIMNQAVAEKEKFKIYTQFNTERNEIFFAKKILLVEGKSDKILFSNLAQKRNLDLNEKGISIIECGGKGGVLYFLGVCQLLGMNNYFGIRDQDDPDAYEDKFNIFGQAIDQGKGLEIEKNLEIFLQKKSGIEFSGNSAQKVKQAYEWSMTINIDNILDEFKIVKDFLNN